MYIHVNGLVGPLRNYTCYDVYSASIFAVLNHNFIHTEGTRIHLRKMQPFDTFFVFEVFRKMWLSVNETEACEEGEWWIDDMFISMSFPQLEHRQRI